MKIISFQLKPELSTEKKPTTVRANNPKHITAKPLPVKYNNSLSTYVMIVLLLSSLILLSIDFCLTYYFTC